MYQNIDFLKRRHEPYVIISSGDCVYKLDFNRVLDFHIEKKSDITVVCKDMMYNDDVSRFGVVRMDEESRITEFDEKPIEASSNTISTGIYVIRRRQLIELLEAAAEENRFDFVNDILVRYKNVKKIYGYKINSYWNNIADIDAYFKTNMDFLRLTSEAISSGRSRQSVQRWTTCHRPSLIRDQTFQTVSYQVAVS